MVGEVGNVGSPKRHRARRMRPRKRAAAAWSRARPIVKSLFGSTQRIFSKRGVQRRLGAAIGVVLLFIALLNSTVNWVGSSGIFILDPRSLVPKIRALALYGGHRTGCVLLGEVDTRIE